MTRTGSKLKKLSDKCVIASPGFQADAVTLQKTLHARQVTYQHNHGRPMSCIGMAQLLSNTLYFKRFFPYYTFNIVGGLDDEGKGAVFAYDAVGSYERTPYMAQGSGKSLIMPVLDNQLKAPSPLLVPPQKWENAISEEDAIDLIKDVFASAGERDIYTGDNVEICVINKDGVRWEEQALKLD